MLASLGVDACMRFATADRSEIPAPARRENYHGTDHVAYWLSGLADRELFRRLIGHRDGDASLRDVLDLGCSSGRLLRHFAALPGVRCWGCDIDVPAVQWLRTHLPAVRAFTGTVLPTLPLPDASIDVVTALSVFTHVDEFEEAWLLELRRVLRPGGHLLASIHPERTWAEMPARHGFLAAHLTKPGQAVDGRQLRAADFEGPLPSERVVVADARSAVYNLNVFHAEEYVHRMWSRLFDVERIVSRAHGPHQDLVVMRRRAD